MKFLRRIARKLYLTPMALVKLLLLQAVCFAGGGAAWRVGLLSIETVLVLCWGTAGLVAASLINRRWVIQSQKTILSSLSDK